MKSLSKIIARYLTCAVVMFLVTLFLNFFLYVLCGFQTIRVAGHDAGNIRRLSEQLEETDGGIHMTEEGCQILDDAYEWAMLLDEQGHVIWNRNLPAHLNHPYTVTQTASFSKWYLDDYPVTEWITDYGLLVAAQPRGAIWKYNLRERVEVIRYLAFMVPITIGSNLFLLFLMVFVLGFRFYRSLRKLETGIEQLSEEKTVHLPEKGMTELLARQLNRTSDLLSGQREQLARRDDARAAWISAVSHDIRTPLSLIMGYASDLKEDPEMTGSRRHLAAIIEAQSLKIKRLIEDLNLVSRLEYDMQPLRPAALKPSRLLRTIVSDLCNQGLSDAHKIDLYVDPDVEQLTLNGDPALLTRAFSNLIQNSIRHNPQGCTVTVTAYPEADGVCFQISDDGCGIPKAVIQALTDTLPESEKAPHIMGLRIAWQIFRAHGWQMLFSDCRTIHILGHDSSGRES